eukprot:SAG11_NODE_519_length_8789_cov_17.198044_3_plen_151_part_00
MFYPGAPWTIQELLGRFTSSWIDPRALGFQKLLDFRSSWIGPGAPGRSRSFWDKFCKNPGAPGPQVRKNVKSRKFASSAPPAGNPRAPRQRPKCSMLPEIDMEQLPRPSEPRDMEQLPGPSEPGAGHGDPVVIAQLASCGSGCGCCYILS